MDWRVVVRAGVIGIAALVAAAPPVRAQEAKPVPRPYRALFGGDASNLVYRHQVSMVVSLNAGLDNGLAASPGTGATTGGTQVAGIYSAGTRLSYALSDRHVNAGAAAGTNLPYYSTLPGVKELAFDASGNLSYLWNVTTLGVTASYSRSPFYSPAFEPGTGAAPLTGEAGFARNPNEMKSATAFLTRRLGRLTGVSVGYEAFSLTFLDEDRSSTSHAVRLSGDRQVSRSLSLTSGYGHSFWSYGPSESAGTSGSDDADIGLRYIRPSPTGRPFTFSAAFGVSTADYQSGRSTGWRGAATLSKVLSATWTVSANYRHTIRLDSAVTEPVWASDVSAAIGGPFGRRVTVAATASYSKRERTTAGAAGFDSYSLSTDVLVAASSAVAIAVNYLYYRYQFPAGYTLPTGVSSKLDRHRLQAGVRIWLPFWRAGRGFTPTGTGQQRGG